MRKVKRNELGFILNHKFNYMTDEQKVQKSMEFVTLIKTAKDDADLLGLVIEYTENIKELVKSGKEYHPYSD